MPPKQRRFSLHWLFLCQCLTARVPRIYGPENVGSEYITFCQLWHISPSTHMLAGRPAFVDISFVMSFPPYGCAWVNTCWSGWRPCSYCQPARITQSEICTQVTFQLQPCSSQLSRSEPNTKVPSTVHVVGLQKEATNTALFQKSTSVPRISDFMKRHIYHT